MKKTKRTTYSIIFMLIGLFINLALALAKFYVGYVSGSLTIIMDSINNFLDLAFNAVAVIAFIIIMKKADEEMPYGYGRAEYIASFLLSLFILLSGAYFLIRSLQNVMIPVNLIFNWAHIVILIASIVIKIVMGALFVWANKSIKSNVFKGVIVDSFIDSTITLLAVIGFALSRYLITLDSIFGIIIALIFIALGIRMLIGSFLVVLGKDNLDYAKKINLEEDLLRCEGINEIKELTFHDYGFGKIIAVAKIVINEDKIENIKALKAVLEEKYSLELVVDIFSD